ncbi:MAG: hypothetical protein KA764_04325 [Anaerolineales bacterium]|nr:hypothetical protein [Anaerolineales bacterium]
MSMHAGDPRYTSFPAQPGLEQLRWYIRQTAAGHLTIHEFLQEFRRLHEDAERLGAPAYASPDEARAIWDVLWAVEFCAPAAVKIENPDDWYIPEEVLVIVQRAAKHLAA